MRLYRIRVFDRDRGWIAEWESNIEAAKAVADRMVDELNTSDDPEAYIEAIHVPSTKVALLKFLNTHATDGSN